MGKVYFSLKDSSAEDTSIILFYNCIDGRLKYYTGETINPKKWPEGINRGMQAQINRMRQTVEELISDFKVKNQQLTKQIVKENLDSIYKTKNLQQSNFFDDMLFVIAKMEAGKILTPRTKKRYSKGTLKGIRHTVRILQSFDKNITQAGVNPETYKRFIHYCHEKNFSTNYIGGQIKNWKTLGKAIGGNPVYDSEDFKILSEDTFDIYLDESELKKIYALPLTGRKERARDWFILDCYTGLRVSDLTLLTKKNYSKGMITIANEKTDEQVTIPVHPYVKAIYSKYKGFPPRVSDQELNRVIKGVAKEAGIKGTVLFTITKGGKREDHYLKKWQMVSNHTSRRSFITNLLKRGVSETLVMKLTGIKAHATLKRYNRMTTGEAAKIMSQHPFFK